MKDVNEQIQDAYFSLLDGNIVVNGNTIPVYSDSIPAGVSVNQYILINSITNVNKGLNDDVASNIICNVWLQVIVKDFNNVNSAIASKITNGIYTAIYPNTVDCPVQIANGQVLTTEVTHDITTSNLTDGAMKIVKRDIIFSHKINIF